MIFLSHLSTLEWVNRARVERKASFLSTELRSVRNFTCFASFWFSMITHLTQIREQINSRDSRCVIFQQNVDVNRLICLSLVWEKLLWADLNFQSLEHIWKATTLTSMCGKGEVNISPAFSFKIVSRESTEDFLGRRENQFSDLSSIDSIFLPAACVSTPRDESKLILNRFHTQFPQMGAFHI